MGDEAQPACENVMDETMALLGSLRLLLLPSVTSLIFCDDFCMCVCAGVHVYVNPRATQNYFPLAKHSVGASSSEIFHSAICTNLILHMSPAVLFLPM